MQSSANSRADLPEEQWRLLKWRYVLSAACVEWGRVGEAEISCVTMVVPGAGFVRKWKGEECFD